VQNDDLQRALFIAVAKGSLPFVFDGYQLCDDGAFYFSGQRPGPDWHVLGSFDTHPSVLHLGELTTITVRKKRWRLRDRSKTCHSRPPDNIGSRYCTLVIAVSLAAWLDAALGLHSFALPYDTAEDRPSRRTLQRWLRAAIPFALPLQQVLYKAALQRCGPRWEEFVPRGHPPPRESRWPDPNQVFTLQRGLAATLITSMKLKEPTAILLAEARRGWTPPVTKTAA